MAIKSPPLTPLLASTPAQSIGPRPSLPSFEVKSPLPAALRDADGLPPPTPILDTPRRQAESPHSYDSTKKPPAPPSSARPLRVLRRRSGLDFRMMWRPGSSRTWATRRRMRRGRRSRPVCLSADVDSVLSRWRGRLLPSPPASAPPGSPKSPPTQTTTATLSRLVPHLSNEKKLAKAARVLTEVLKQAPLAITGRTAADRARCQALKTADSGALRDAIALS